MRIIVIDGDEDDILGEQVELADEHEGLNILFSQKQIYHKPFLSTLLNALSRNLLPSASTRKTC